MKLPRKLKFIIGAENSEKCNSECFYIEETSRLGNEKISWLKLRELVKEKIKHIQYSKVALDSMEHKIRRKRSLMDDMWILEAGISLNWLSPPLDFEKKLLKKWECYLTSVRSLGKHQWPETMKGKFSRVGNFIGNSFPVLLEWLCGWIR